MPKKAEPPSYSAEFFDHSARAGITLSTAKIVDNVDLSVETSDIHVTTATEDAASKWDIDLTFQQYYVIDSCVAYISNTTSSDIIRTMSINEEVYCSEQVVSVNENINWHFIAYQDESGNVNIGYIDEGYLSISPIGTTDYSIPSYDGFKSYMGYDKITSVSTPAYKLSRMSISDENGLMTYNGRYLIAVGFYFDVQVGDYIDLVLENGEVIPCIVGDRKALIDTGEQGLFTSNGCMSEFIVATWNLPAEVKRTGNVSVLHNWNSPVTSVITYDKNVLNNES